MSRASRAIARRRAAQTITIAKSPTTAVRVSLCDWRERYTIELAEATTRGLANLFYASGASVSLPVEKLPELLDALESLSAEARRLGLLEERQP
jgi:hypothetical protein